MQAKSGAIVVGVLGSALEPSEGRAPVMGFGAAAPKELEADIETAVKVSSGSRVRFVNGGDANAEVLSTQARDLVRREVAVIVAVGTPATIAAATATKSLPIVMVGVADPVALGLVRSLARPGGNISGVSLLGPEMLEKSVDLLLEAAPSIRRPAFLWNPANPGAALSLRHMQKVAATKGLNFVSVPVEQAARLDRVMADLEQMQHDALMLLHDSIFVATGERLLAYCAARRLPTSFSTAAWVIKGGLMSYEPQAKHMYRRAAAYVGRILAGAKPMDLPVEQPTLFSFVLNIKTANSLGLTIPASLLVRADHVID
jgi:putative ABC transport system substrate-binding protein